MLFSSKLLKERINEIINKNTFNSFVMTCVVKSYDDEEMEITIRFIDSLKIKQLFHDDYLDNINLFCQVSPIDYMTMIENKSSLYCILKIEYVNYETGDYVLDEELEIYYFRIFLQNTEDLFKKYHISAFERYQKEEIAELLSHQTSLIPVSMQLFENDSYDLHRQEITGTYTGIKVEKLLKFITAKFNIKRISLYKVDNDTEFQNIIIRDGVNKIETIYDYIQKEYGVYKKGLGYYFFKGVLYIYPCYDTNIKSKRAFVIYRTPKNSYLGLKNYHSEFTTEEGRYELGIVSSGKLESVNLLTAGLEKDGTNIMFIKSDRVMDDSVTLEDGKFSINSDNIITVSSTYNQAVSKDAPILKHIKPTMNFFKASSELEQNNAELVIFSWEYSRLFRIYPNMEVYFYYDKEEVELRKGIVHSVIYDVLKQEKSVEGFNYIANAKITLRLEPTKK